jgi:hypothetical protein
MARHFQKICSACIFICQNVTVKTQKANMNLYSLQYCFESHSSSTKRERHLHKKKIKHSLKTRDVAPKLIVTDPDPTFQRVPDPVSDPALNNNSSSRNMILKVFQRHIKT